MCALFVFLSLCKKQLRSGERCGGKEGFISGCFLSIDLMVCSPLSKRTLKGKRLGARYHNMLCTLDLSSHALVKRNLWELFYLSTFLCPLTHATICRVECDSGPFSTPLPCPSFSDTSSSTEADVSCHSIPFLGPDWIRMTASQSHVVGSMLTEGGKRIIFFWARRTHTFCLGSC